MMKTRTAPKNNMPPIHPGKILREEYLAPLEMSANQLAQAIGVRSNRITEIVAERGAITADTALRLGKALRTSPQFWLNLQQAYELRRAEHEGAASLRAIRPIIKVG